MREWKTEKKEKTGSEGRREREKEEEKEKVKESKTGQLCQLGQSEKVGTILCQLQCQAQLLHQKLNEEPKQKIDSL